MRRGQPSRPPRWLSSKPKNELRARLYFDQHQPQHFLWIAYTQPLPRLAEAIARIDGILGH